jgi:hypothetical protein
MTKSEGIGLEDWLKAVQTEEYFSGEEPQAAGHDTSVEVEDQIYEEKEDKRWTHVPDSFQKMFDESASAAESKLFKKETGPPKGTEPYKSMHKDGILSFCVPKDIEGEGGFLTHICLMASQMGGTGVQFLTTEEPGAFTTSVFPDTVRQVCEAMHAAIKLPLASGRLKDDSLLSLARNTVLHVAVKVALSTGKFSQVQKLILSRCLDKEEDKISGVIDKWYAKIAAASKNKNYDATFKEIVRLVCTKRAPEVRDNLLVRLPFSSNDLKLAYFPRKNRTDFVKGKKTVTTVIEQPWQPWSSPWLASSEEKALRLVWSGHWRAFDGFLKTLDKLSSKSAKHNNLASIEDLFKEEVEGAKQVSDRASATLAFRKVIVEKYVEAQPDLPRKKEWGNRDLLRAATDHDMFQKLDLPKAVFWHPLYTLARFPQELAKAKVYSSSEYELKRTMDNPMDYSEMGVANLMNWWKTCFKQFSDTDPEVIQEAVRAALASDKRTAAGIESVPEASKKH